MIDVFEQIQSEIDFSIENDIVESETIYTEPIELGDGVNLMSTETAPYNEDGTIKGNYSVKVQPELDENIKTSRAVINTGGYNWKYVNTKYIYLHCK